MKKTPKKYAPQIAWRKRNPHIRLLEFARRRCKDTKHRNFKFYDGVKVTLTGAEIKAIWERDNGASMKTPSLDRIDPCGDYTFENCRVIEKSLNERLPHMTSAEFAELGIAVDAGAEYV